MKHAYLITANGNFSVLNSCLKMLDYESNDIYITFDKKTFKSSNDVRNIITPLAKANLDVDFQVINWGGIFSSFRCAVND